MKEKWENVVDVIQKRWNTLIQDEIRQSNGITELASLISRKTGEPRPNVLHEIIHLIRTVDQNHSLVQEYLQNNRMQGDDDNFLKDTGRTEPRL
jgi:hypothetical protein